MNLFWLMTKEPLFNDHPCALVAADTKEQAEACMITGSDSLWCSVYQSVFAGTLEMIPGQECFYRNCGAIVLAMTGPPIPLMNYSPK